MPKATESSAQRRNLLKEIERLAPAMISPRSLVSKPSLRSALLFVPCHSSVRPPRCRTTS